VAKPRNHVSTFPAVALSHSSYSSRCVGSLESGWWLQETGVISVFLMMSACPAYLLLDLGCLGKP
jgi:hypothetical protein